MGEGGKVCFDAVEPSSHRRCRPRHVRRGSVNEEGREVGSDDTDQGDADGHEYCGDTP
jgi:hypothetical protein